MFTFVIFTQNKPGVLYRIADLFLRRKINIESLTVSHSQKPTLARFTITADVDKLTAEKLAKQLYRIVEVLKVFKESDENLIFSEIALIKVFAKNPQKRKEIEDIVFLFGAKIKLIGKDFLIIEKTGTEDEIQSLFLLLKPFGIQDFVRSGRIALMKEEKIPKGPFYQVLPSSFVDIPAIKSIQQLIEKEPGGISLAQGIHQSKTPIEIKQKLIQFVKEGFGDKYSPPAGLEKLRERLAEKLNRENKIQAGPENIIITHGAMEALMATFLALFGPKDEIIVLTPDYISHLTQIQIARHGAKPTFVPLRETENGWSVDFEKLENAISQKTKAILICNPSNPTGKVYLKEELKEIARLSLKYNLFVIVDEVYEDFIFDKREHISLASFKEISDRVITVFSFSKSYAMSGWRLGYLVADKMLVKEILKIHNSLINCPTVISQGAALIALENKEIPLKFKKCLEKKREIVGEILAQTKKLKFSLPQATFYAFPKLNFEVDDYDFALKLLKKQKVGVVPGSAFGLGGENHIRISFWVEDEKLKEGLKRLVDFLEKFY